MQRNFEDSKEVVMVRLAEEIALAARTAPKARGQDLLEIVIVSGDELKMLSKQMKEVGDRENNPTLQRDSQNLLSASAVILIGTKTQHLGLKYCGFCGWRDCAEAKKQNALCAFNAGDLGIAIGSAVSRAADLRVDNRVMYSIGIVAIEKKYFSPEVKIAYGIPLSASGKNPFFDRKQ